MPVGGARRQFAALAAAGILGMPAAVPSRAHRRAASDLPPSHLSARIGGAWRTIWTSASPERPTISDTAFDGALRWSRGAAGVEWTEVAIAGTGEAWRTRVIAARIDPAKIHLGLDTAVSDGAAAWTLAHAPRDAEIAFNAGQFEYSKPWGLVVLDGLTMLAPGTGPLATTVAIGADGSVRLIHGSTAIPARAKYAFQSYPTLIAAGSTPPALRRAGLGVDVAHRDARAALGVDRDGRVLVVLTRFDALGGLFGAVPFGLTTPEMAGLMLVFGARDAVMLDGGISAQLMVRDAQGTPHRWPGIRAVPLAVIGRAAR